MSDEYKFGIEEEYFLVDAETKSVAREMPPTFLEKLKSVTDGQAMGEMLQSQLEVATARLLTRIPLTDANPTVLASPACDPPIVVLVAAPMSMPTSARPGSPFAEPIRLPRTVWPLPPAIDSSTLSWPAMTLLSTATMVAASSSMPFRAEPVTWSGNATIVF